MIHILYAILSRHFNNRSLIQNNHFFALIKDLKFINHPLYFENLICNLSFLYILFSLLIVISGVVEVDLRDH